nr:DUF6387 family protein [Pseudomonas aromaticivorans]
MVLQSSADRDAAEDGECAPWFAERWKLVANGVDTFADLLDDALILEDHGPKAITHAAVLAVNLQANDSVLMAAFAAWLKDARIKHPTAKRERPAYWSWAAYGLLPYLDLLIWAKETGSQIPHHVMAEAVGYRKGGDSFRKTVPKLATELMHNLGELEALAAIEAASEKLGA